MKKIVLEVDDSHFESILDHAGMLGFESVEDLLLDIVQDILCAQSNDPFLSVRKRQNRLEDALRQRLGIAEPDPISEYIRYAARHGRVDFKDVYFDDTEAPDETRVEVALAIATEIFGSEERALRWLYKPNRSLDGDRPIDLLKESDGLTQVKSVLQRIQRGLIS